MTYPNIAKKPDNCRAKLCQFAGQSARKDDVRECSHGRIWICTRSSLSFYKGQYNSVTKDWEQEFVLNPAYWQYITWWANPFLYRRAKRALNPPIASWNVI